MIEHIYDHSQLLAIIIYPSYDRPGIEFFTEDESTQQLGYIQRNAGEVIRPHRHNEVSRLVTLTQEVLYIRKGKVRIDFYSEAEDYLESRIITTGGAVLLSTGGHGFEMVEDSEIIEVKQGPYLGDRDKVRFEHISSDKVRYKK
jgi:hypothetical protein